MANGSIGVEGLREALELLKSLPPELVSKNGGVVRYSLYAAANLVRTEAVRNAPRSEGKPLSGRLSRNLILMRHKNPEKLGVNEDYALSVRTGPRGKARRAYNAKLRQKGISGFRDDPNDAWYARFVEFGTKNMQTHASKGFMRAAFESNMQRATQVFTKRLQAGIAKAIKKSGVKK